MVVRLLSGGAATGLVARLAERFAADTGQEIEGDFGAVGGMRDRVVSGEQIDLVILTRAIVEQLADQGFVEAESVTDIGQVVTGVAVLEGTTAPDVSSPDALGAALGNATALYVPDTLQATAGIHVAKVVDALGLKEQLEGRIHEFPNGQTAMAEMARSGDARALGSTQITEILNTPGVVYGGPLPDPHGLSTMYTAAVSTAAAQPRDARKLIELLALKENASIRESVGFS